MRNSSSQTETGSASPIVSPTTESSTSMPGLDERLTNPPRAPLVLRVGVVGHRPDPKKRAMPDTRALQNISGKLLLHIQDTFAGVADAHRDLFSAPPKRPDGKPAGLRLISALAEGADQWVASKAAELGYELQAVLPFEQSEYEQDFQDSRILSEFRRLRGLATALFEMDGCRERSGESYLAAGRVILNQTDLLVALWDGKDSHGIGGTGQIVREALQRGIPTLWVNWGTPSSWHLMRPAWRLIQQPIDVQGDMRLLAEQVTELLVPLYANHNGREPNDRQAGEAYFRERRRSWTLLGGWWNFFRDLLRGRPAPLTIRVPEFIPATRASWHKDWHGGPGEKRQHKLPRPVIDWVEHSIIPHYAWANHLSIYYANHYRSSFVWIYLLGTMAVLLALIGKTAHASHTVEVILIAAEVIVICIIIGLTGYGRRRRWHERWIDYRTLAERLRLVHFYCLLGGLWQNANVPSHLATYGNPAATWMQWHARAVERAVGLPRIAVRTDYLSACKELLLEALIEGQENYHEENVKRLGSTDRRLHRFGEWLFIATLIGCVVHLIVGLRWERFGESAEAWDRWLIFCAAFLPALGAAMAAIRSQGEFHRVVQRSRAMSDELEQLKDAVANIPTRPNELNSQLLQQAVEQTTRLMYNEVLDWRIVFQDRPLVWPA
ncbi:MAG: hypothetical protein WAV47_13870 [Blastocatellia bacterium]